MKLLSNAQLRLRAPEPEDLRQFYAWENNTDLWKYSATISPYSYYALKEYIAQGGGDFYEQKQVRFVISLKASHVAIGYVDLFDYDPFHHRAGVGVLVDAAYQGQGYAKQALQLLSDYAFEFLGLHQLYAHVPEQNTASVNLFGALNYTRVGVLKDWIRVGRNYEDVFLYQLFS